MNKRILDRLHPGAFRLFLALVVLVSHSCRVDLGAWAVYSFFTLSGYWIHRMWTQKYARSDSPLLVFFASRFLRILPIFWIANLLSAVARHCTDPLFLAPAEGNWRGLPALASNLLVFGYANLPHSQGGLDAAWTLDIEMQFYLAFPLVLYLVSRRRLGTFWAVVIGGACAWGAAAYVAQPDPAPRTLSCFGMFFLIGLMAAHRGWAPSTRLASASLWAFAGLVALFAVVPGFHFILGNGKHGGAPGDFPVKLAIQIILGVVSAPVALFTVRNPSGPLDRTVSELTYVAYLAQWPVMVVHGYLFAHLAPVERIPSVAAAWVVVAAVTWVVFRWVDQPLEAVRKRWVSSHLT